MKEKQQLRGQKKRRRTIVFGSTLFSFCFFFYKRPYITKRGGGWVNLATKYVPVVFAGFFRDQA